MNLAIVIFITPLFLALLMAANRKQDINLIQAQWNASDSVRNIIKNRIAKSGNYKKSNMVIISSFPVATVAAISSLFGYRWIMIFGVLLIIIQFIVGVWYRIKGFNELVKQRV